MGALSKREPQWCFSFLCLVGLRCADQILEYNGVDLRLATAEQAAYELAKPAEKVAIYVLYNPESKFFFLIYYNKNIHILDI